MQAHFLACRAPRVPMLATAIAAVVNLVGDVVLCQGFGMGVRGAAAATSGARAATTLPRSWELLTDSHNLAHESG